MKHSSPDIYILSTIRILSIDSRDLHDFATSVQKRLDKYETAVSSLDLGLDTSMIRQTPH